MEGSLGISFQNLVRTSFSQLAPQSFLLRKNAVSLCLCMDYQALNNITVTDAYLIVLQSSMSSWRHSAFCLVIHHVWSLQHLPLGLQRGGEHEEASVVYLAQPCGWSTRMPGEHFPEFGLFQNFINNIFRGIVDQVTATYADDSLILSEGWATHNLCVHLVFVVYNLWIEDGEGVESRTSFLPGQWDAVRLHLLVPHIYSLLGCSAKGRVGSSYPMAWWLKHIAKSSMIRFQAFLRWKRPRSGVMPT